MTIDYYPLREYISHPAKNQWLNPHKNIPPEEICDPDTAELPGPPHPADPYRVHHRRTKRVGKLLAIVIPKIGYFREYRSFLKGIATFLEPSGQAIKGSLTRVGLWWAGQTGQAGGPQLIQMQAEIVAYAQIHGGDLG